MMQSNRAALAHLRSLPTSSRNSLCVGSSRLLSSSTGPKKFKSNAERVQYLTDANAKMESYHHAREQMRKGQLKSKNASSNNNNNSGAMQMGVVGLFLVAFLTTPYIGRKIATDEEFRTKYVPSWYDFTVRKPENPWTREELNDQIYHIQKELHRRAQAGDFSPEKLKALEERLQQHEQAMEEGEEKGEDGQTKKPSKAALEAKQHQAWDRLHPGLEEGEHFLEKDD